MEFLQMLPRIKSTFRRSTVSVKFALAVALTEWTALGQAGIDNTRRYAYQAHFASRQLSEHTPNRSSQSYIQEVKETLEQRATLLVHRLAGQ